MSTVLGPSLSLLAVSRRHIALLMVGRDERISREVFREETGRREKGPVLFHARRWDKNSRPETL